MISNETPEIGMDMARQAMADLDIFANVDAMSQHMMRLAKEMMETQHEATHAREMHAALTAATSATARLAELLRLLEETNRRHDQDRDDATNDAELVRRLGEIHAAGPIIGIRAWRTIQDENRCLLSSVHMNTIWRPGRAAVGDVWYSLDEGIHAFKTGTDLAIYLMRQESCDSKNIVCGTVSLGGWIVEHQDGYRAQSAYPTNVVTRDAAQAAKIARTYGCETEVAARPFTR